MRSPLSRSQTPAISRKTVGFFGSGCLAGHPVRLITQPTSDWQLIRKPTLSAVDGCESRFLSEECQRPLLVQMCKTRVRVRTLQGASQRFMSPGVVIQTVLIRSAGSLLASVGPPRPQNEENGDQPEKSRQGQALQSGFNPASLPRLPVAMVPSVRLELGWNLFCHAPTPLHKVSAEVSGDARVFF